ncbi:MAG: Lipid export ATP-binding/permease protein MsbA [Pseudomonadota bacterium]|jgi:ATP-binding cassette subfamily B protein
MRHHSHSDVPPANAKRSQTDWQTLSKLLPYLMMYKWRVGMALAFMIGAKLANVGVPLLLKQLIDAMTLTPQQAILAVPVALLVAYGLLRLSVSVFTELREWVFAEVTQGSAKRMALQVFDHLHSLSLRFHLERQTGGMSRDIERGVRGLESLVSYSLYSIVPTLFEVLLVLCILGFTFDVGYSLITLGALVTYIVFTVKVTQWRTHFRREANAIDSQAHTQAIDALLNYETVKYFGNEAYESERYAQSLDRLRRARLKAQSSLSLLNSGQQLIIAAALVWLLWRATEGVVDGKLTLGDLVMINAFLIQLYIPLNFLGVVYREIKQGLTDLDRMFALMEKNREVADRPDAQELILQSAPQVSFSGVRFAYEADRPILHEVNLTIEPGCKLAVVGASGSGKSTLARLLFRFYDINEGQIAINGTDIRSLTQTSLRRAIGIVPQDTVLFNDTVRYNIAYGRPDATREEIEAAAKAARIHDFIVSTPKGYDTLVGERGLKLSGGEKQRVAIARTLLKNPQILIFDEATSALDSANERAIQTELMQAARNKTTLVIAHRLSTIVDADCIVVLDQGQVIEQGTHAQLLQRQGRYAQMWQLQQSQSHQGMSLPSSEELVDGPTVPSLSTTR